MAGGNLVARVLHAALAEYRLPLDGIHGPAHWARVLENGRRIAREVEVDLEIVELFAVLHDSRRRGEGDDDAGHGPRAAEFAAGLRAAGLIALDDDRFDRLYRAISGHTSGRTHSDATIGACWDSDRLDLGRPGVGIAPDPRYLSTAVARRPDVIESAHAIAARGEVPLQMERWGFRVRLDHGDRSRGVAFDQAPELAADGQEVGVTRVGVAGLDPVLHALPPPIQTALPPMAIRGRVERHPAGNPDSPGVDAGDYQPPLLGLVPVPLGRGVGVDLAGQQDGHGLGLATCQVQGGGPAVGVAPGPIAGGDVDPAGHPGGSQAVAEDHRGPAPARAVVQDHPAVRPVSGEPLPVFAIGRVARDAMSGPPIPCRDWRGGLDGIHAIPDEHDTPPDDRRAIILADSLDHLLNYQDHPPGDATPLPGWVHLIAVRDGRIAGRISTFPHHAWRPWDLRLGTVGPPTVTVIEGDRLRVLAGANVAPDHRGRHLGRALVRAACLHHGLAGPEEFLFLPEPGEERVQWDLLRRHRGQLGRAVYQVREALEEWDRHRRAAGCEWCSAPWIKSHL